MQQLVHYFLHFLFPGIVAYLFYREVWLKTYGIFLLTMLVDLDHLLANPIFDACRCSIGYHPLHQYAAIVIYCLLLFVPKVRIIAIGLLMHMVTDQIDCIWNSVHCP